LSQGKRKKLARDIGLKELLDAYSPSVDELLAACGQKVCSELWGRAGRQLVMTGVPRAKVLALPAPAKSLPPVHYDLVSTFDAATAAEQQKFARERANEFLAAVV
jgi:hypothetical protein